MRKDRKWRMRGRGTIKEMEGRKSGGGVEKRRVSEKEEGADVCATEDN